MNRYYLPPGDWQENTLQLTGDEAKHCSRVMRAKLGDTIEIFDGEGNFSTGEITGISNHQVTCSIIEQKQQPRNLAPVTLCQAIPKSGNMELIVQKSVELGVHRIQPLLTDHTVARPDSLEKKRIKWQRIALEACKQCGQNYLPEISPVLNFSDWLTTTVDKNAYSLALVAALDSKSVHLKNYFNGKTYDGNIALLVGPEGDFSPVEYEAAYTAGFKPISFGSIVMRVETASIYGLSIIQHELSHRELT